MTTTESDFSKRTAAHIRAYDPDIIQWGNRRAKIIYTLAQFPRDYNLEQLLSEKSGKTVANHTVYEISFTDTNKVAISFDDSVMCLGVGVKTN